MAVEQVGQRPGPIRCVECVRIIHLDHWQATAPGGQRVQLAGEILFLEQQLVTGTLPFVCTNDVWVSHGPIVPRRRGVGKASQCSPAFRGAPYALAMGSAVPAAEPPATAPPATTIDEVIARMQAIEAALPGTDGVACFNRMYLDVTLEVNREVNQGSFGEPAFMSHLDVVFANLYFDAVDALSGPPSGFPAAWQPLLVSRAVPGIEPIQFALAGMNAHINHDLPLAVVATCTDLGTTPDDGSHHSDYRKVDALLDASEQSVRESFEPPDVVAVDRHVASVANLVGNWDINVARDIAWDTALALWDIRDHQVATRLLTEGLARTVAMASRGLLVAV